MSANSCELSSTKYYIPMGREYKGPISFPGSSTMEIHKKEHFPVSYGVTIEHKPIDTFAITISYNGLNSRPILSKSHDIKFIPHQVEGFGFVQIIFRRTIEMSILAVIEKEGIRIFKEKDLEKAIGSGNEALISFEYDKKTRKKAKVLHLMGNLFPYETNEKAEELIENLALGDLIKEMEHRMSCVK